MEKAITITPGEIAAVFTEWDTRFRENPEWFESQAVVLLKYTPVTYGEQCAPFFLELLNEIKLKENEGN